VWAFMFVVHTSNCHGQNCTRRAIYRLGIDTLIANILVIIIIISSSSISSSIEKRTCTEAVQNAHCRCRDLLTSYVRRTVSMWLEFPRTACNRCHSQWAAWSHGQCASLDHLYRTTTLPHQRLSHSDGQVLTKKLLARSTPATMSKQHCRMLQCRMLLRQSRTLFPHCC